MKCEINLIREILLQIENSAPNQTWVDVQLDGVRTDPKAVSRHVRLLNQAGYVEARKLDEDWKPVRLTWDGRDFLDLAKNKEVWRNTERKVGPVAGSLNRLRIAVISAIQEIYA